jgi:hypothetical protein
MKTAELVTKITDTLCQGPRMAQIIDDKFPDKIDELAKLAHAVYDHKKLYNSIYPIIINTPLAIGQIKPLANFGITPKPLSAIVSNSTIQNITKNGENKQR